MNTVDLASVEFSGACHCHICCFHTDKDKKCLIIGKHFSKISVTFKTRSLLTIYSNIYHNASPNLHPFLLLLNKATFLAYKSSSHYIFSFRKTGFL